MQVSLDWSAPWFGSIVDTASAVLAHADWLAALNVTHHTPSLTNHRGKPLRFVAQSALPADTSYEAFISDTGCVPTRNNLHDFFNALVWLSFPRIKAQLNALQAAQIAQEGIGPSRGRTRDTVTLFDENAAILAVRQGSEGQALVEALRAHQWQRVFLDLRSHFGTHAEAWIFGHALMEKLVNPYKSITAHTWVLSVPDAFFTLPQASRRAWLDEVIAGTLQSRDAASLTPACFTPLPVLGIPGWWQGQDAEFYADTQIFRPRRAARTR
ncbi:DUF3025 domain-containing protein [Viridibacterium curvum]|uniref:DUF3025 domain-containing protein n=1 Tax=Viridibacterium curvum TaxID=1101404 RepID=A0ABP9QTD0_9RHOO